MTVEFLNLPYFAFIIFAIILNIVLYKVLKNKSLKTKKIVLFSILAFNLALHFLKLLFPPYSTNPDTAVRDIWFINICAVSVLAYPFFFLSKSKVLKDFMFYLGMLSGVLALLIPTEALGKYIWSLDLFRFYTAHIILLTVPLLMVLLKVHTLDYKRIWKIPFIVLGYMLFIITQQVLQSELGFTSLRSSDFFDPSYRNTSFIWGPTDDLAVFFTIFTPNFLKIVPYGIYAGQIKYWPFFWIIPGVFVYFIMFPLLFCLPFEHKHIKSDIKNLISKIKQLFTHKAKN